MSSAAQPIVTLNSGQLMPQLGLGVYKVNQDIAVQLVQEALSIGYRRIDTAALYDNEAEVGAAIRKSGLAREEVFVTSKIWNDRQGYLEAKEAIQESVDRLNIDYVDMMLIHWPCPKQDKFVETWRAFEEVLETGLVRGIGVSNFNQPHLEKLLASANVTPAINQVELHPQLAQPVAGCANHSDNPPTNQAKAFICCRFVMLCMCAAGTSPNHRWCGGTARNKA